MLYNVFFAGAWVAVAVVLFFWEPLTGQPEPFVKGTSMPLAGLAVLLAAYNLVRWYAGRSAGAEPVLPPPSPHRRQDEPPNPAFDFKKGPGEQ